MHRILEAVLAAYVLFTCIRFVCMNGTNASAPLVTSTLSSATEGNSTDVWSEYSHEHIAVQKWRKIYAHTRKLCLEMYNKILPFVINYDKETELSAGCTSAVMKTLAGLRQCKTWTFKMIDASGKIPAGIFKLETKSIGNYDECLEVNVPGQFQGQYCNVDLIQPAPERQRFRDPRLGLPEFENFSRSVPPDSVIAEVIKLLSWARHVSTSTAICVPSACSKEEIQKIATKAVEKLGIYTSVVIRSCETLQDRYELGSTEIAIMIVFGILLFLVITATIVDVFLKLTRGNYKHDISLPTKYLLCFSFYTNTRRLVTPDTSADTIKVFHGIRVISILWIILGHTFVSHNHHTTTMISSIFSHKDDISFQILQQGYLAVDTFFFLSAAVHCYGILKVKNIKISYSLHILMRMLRLAIPFSFVMASGFLIPYLGSGPFWKEIMESRIIGGCRSNWWKNLLFVNNFIPRKDMCMSWFWYIAVDFHLFLLSLLLIIPMRSKPLLGFVINLLIFLGGICVTEISSFYYGVVQVPRHAYYHTEDRSYLLEKVYHQTHAHLFSCCSGLLVGYFFATRSCKLNINWKLNIATWLSVMLFGLTALFGEYKWNRGDIPNIVYCVLYKSTKQIWWCLVLAWTTIACATGNGGFVNDILTWPVFVPFARLTYMVYLVHPLIHFTYIASTRTFISLDHRSLIFLYVGTVVFSYMCAYVCSLLFESPFTALQNMIFLPFIPEDLKRIKMKDAWTNDGAEMMYKDLLGEMNIKRKNSDGDLDMKQGGYAAVRQQALPD